IHNELKLKPAMSLYAPVLRCKKINVGDMVSYDNEIIKENGYVLTLGLGYGDGWKKEYKTISYYQNEYYHQVGITNMDALMIYSKKQIEDKKYIELLGEHLTIQDLCSCYNISPYDFYSSLSPRIKKEFIT
ncbi:MAG: hypothetical protein IJW93_02970, partial [Clostridia bacterium]|nr:hypothetical protein [Clostridia bacterium]